MRLLLLLLAAACETVVTPTGVINSQIATTTGQEGWAVNYPTQHKMFELAGTLWVFYSDGRDVVSTTSDDGVTWSAPQIVRANATLGHRIGLAFDGVHFHYAFASAESNGDVFYRRGVPASDGTIAWDAPEQRAFAVGDTANAMYPKVVVDALGRPWVAFVHVKGGITTPPYDAIVTMSEATDGTFATAAGFPMTLVADHQQTYPEPVGVALGGGATFWLYNRDDDDGPYFGRLFDGAWHAELPVTQTTGKYALFSISTDNNSIDMVYRGDGVRYHRRGPDGVWSEEVDLTSSGGGHTCITREPDGETVTWLEKDDDQVRFRELAAGEWGPTNVLADESVQALADKNNGINLNCVDASARWKAAAVYTTGTQLPYVLRFAGLPR